MPCARTMLRNARGTEEPGERASPPGGARRRSPSQPRGRRRRQTRARTPPARTRSGMATAATVPPRGTAIWRTPSAQARREAGYTRKSALVPAMGTTAVPTPNSVSAAINGPVESTTAASASPAAPTAVPASVESRGPNLSTALPAAISDNPEPSKAATTTAPSSASVRPYSRLQLRPDSRKAEVDERDGSLRDRGGGEHGSGRRTLRHRWIIVGPWNSARSRALSAGGRRSRLSSSSAIARRRSADSSRRRPRSSKARRSTKRRSLRWMPRMSRSCEQTLHESGQAFEVTFADEDGEDWLDEFRMDGDVAGGRTRGAARRSGATRR